MTVVVPYNEKCGTSHRRLSSGGRLIKTFNTLHLGDTSGLFTAKAGWDRERFRVLLWIATVPESGAKEARQKNVWNARDGCYFKDVSEVEKQAAIHG